MNENSQNSICRICGTNAIHLFKGQIFNRLQVGYFECPCCDYVQTEDPYWLQEAYNKSITASDTGIMLRNQNNVTIVLATLSLIGARRDTVVDFAGGYGILVRMLRDIGIDTFWSDRYSQCLIASGFEYDGRKANLVTAFEAFEHFVNPIEELGAMLSVAPNVLISTVLIPKPTPELSKWWYYVPEHGQHIGFFRIKTLKKLAEFHNKNLITDGHSYHFFTDQNVSVWQWQLLRKIIGKMPRLFCKGLLSKVWSDHLYIINKTK
jgi:hypothetical protein